ncbi:MAG: class I tRNA ligase family protein, partial [Methyloprofundus sp.]|nr:class I tRNA ligase family protein [Methyloprofundus sp.]
HLAEKVEKATRKAYPDGIPAYGTDALRFTFASLASTGRDIRLDGGRIDGYRNFCNKIWNAARFVLMNTEEQDCGLNGGDLEYSQADKWIVSRLNEVIANTSDAIETYRLDHAAQEIYEFIWNEYCDWYLELSKISLQSENEALQRGTRKTLLSVLETILRLAHPIMPFITEEIWQRVAPLAGVQADTIMLQPYPEADVTQHDAEAVAAIEWTKQFILGVRRIRGEMNIAPGKPLPVLLENVTETDQQYLPQAQVYLQKIGRIESISCLTEGDTAPESAIALVNEMRILIPMAGLIDKQAEIARLEKEIAKLEKDLPRIEGKLNNPKFVDKAPAAVIEKEKEKLAKAQSSLLNFNEQLIKIQAL